MDSVIFSQLPVPQLDYGRRTGNIPLAGAALCQAANSGDGSRAALLSPAAATYLGDGALEARLLEARPAWAGFTLYSWNIDRSLYLARRLKAAQGTQIVVGGPEVTADNLRVRVAEVDLAVAGEGEAVIRELMAGRISSSTSWINAPTLTVFADTPSPYLAGLIDPAMEACILLESQRGCPYKCAFCYYSKARGTTARLKREHLNAALDWAFAKAIPEVYLLDPSLNARPRLMDFLNQIATCNPDRRLALISEIRAEAVDSTLAQALAAAGFTMLEVGLQSTNPKALEAMGRPCNLTHWLKGVKLLKAQGITPRIDLILGLPGDTPDDFQASVDFVNAHGLGDDVQVFPLALLPGTEFRRRHQELGLAFAPDPPYPVRATPVFGERDLLLALDYAESALDTALFVMPHLDLRLPEAGQADAWVTIVGRAYLTALGLFEPRPMAEIRRLARRLTHPYQILVGDFAGQDEYLRAALAEITRINPYTPFEVVWLEPRARPDTRALLAALNLARPQFLDLEQRYLFSRPGNRTVLFTVLDRKLKFSFKGPMERAILWWQSTHWPPEALLQPQDSLDGILLDTRGRPDPAIEIWQDRLVPQAEALTAIGFGERRWQNRWLRLTAGDEFYFAVR